MRVTNNLFIQTAEDKLFEILQQNCRLHYPVEPKTPEAMLILKLKLVSLPCEIL